MAKEETDIPGLTDDELRARRRPKREDAPDIGASGQVRLIEQT